MSQRTFDAFKEALPKGMLSPSVALQRLYLLLLNAPERQGITVRLLHEDDLIALKGPIDDLALALIPALYGIGNAA